jgi:5'-methylthioadenosine phosphorylase
MGLLGVISGTLTLQGKGFFNDLKERTLKNEYGEALVLLSRNMAFIPRHGRDPKHHILPHRINHPANLKALKDLGVDEVIGINSTGSLKKKLNPGAIVVPDDFIMLFGGPTVFERKPVHITPMLHEGLRRRCIEAAAMGGIGVVDGGIYWQTQGPRLETRAEIAFMSQMADVVGMTMASEAVIAQELDLPYASICSVDNYAHGIGGEKLTMETILAHARRNADAIISIILKYLEERKS